MSDSDQPSPELQGLDPGELLARGLNTVRPSGGRHNWTPPTPKELARLLPQYHIESMIGHGGMGAVYKGYQPDLDRPVAIKLLPAELSADEQFITRFRREARTLAKLQHPGIVSIYDFGQTSDGHLYFVMEYVDGTDLRHILENPGLNPEQALELTCQVCDALHSAHLQGVIHRDIKPANILITRDGRAKLADFGLARPVLGEEMAGITVTNMVMGTPDYMAPEQHEGQSDHRTDIFALGLMLYEMLTGQRPQGAFEPASSKVSVDVRIDEVVVKALQQEPDRRYQQVSEMKTDVDHIRTVPAPVPVQVRRPVFLIAVSALAVLFLGIGAIYWTTKSGTPATAPLAQIEDAAEPPVEENPPASLEEALLDFDWQYQTARPAKGEKSAFTFTHGLFFQKDGIVYSRGNKETWQWSWTATGPLTVHIDQRFKGFTADLTFDPSFKKFEGRSTEGSTLRGRREKPFTDQDILAIRQEIQTLYPPAGEADANRDQSAAPSPAVPPPPASLEQVLESSVWSCDTTLPTGKRYVNNKLMFLKDGSALFFVDRNTNWKWSWKITGPKTLHIDKNYKEQSLDVTFDDSLQKFAGQYSDGGTITGVWMEATPEELQRFGLQKPDPETPLPAALAPEPTSP